LITQPGEQNGREKAQKAAKILPGFAGGQHSTFPIQNSLPTIPPWDPFSAYLH
jgi:hypothetical protein